MEYANDLTFTIFMFLSGIGILLFLVLKRRNTDDES